MTKLMFMDVGKIKTLMEEKNINIKGMAAAMRVCPETVKRYLGGANQENMNIKVIFKFARALGVTIEKIIHSDYLV